MGRRRTRITGDNWTPELNIIGEEAAWARLSKKYKLPADDELLLLISNIRDRHTRERGDYWTAERFIVERDAARDDLRALISHATTLQQYAAEVHAQITAFADAYEYEPNLMRAIANVSDEDELFAPREFACFDAVWRLTGPNADLASQLRCMSSVSLRKTSTRARVPHLTLRACADMCGIYWDRVGRKANLEALELREVRDGGNPGELTGDFERFLSDALQLVGVRHTLAQLFTVVSRKAPLARVPLQRFSRD